MSEDQEALEVAVLGMPQVVLNLVPREEKGLDADAEDDPDSDAALLEGTDAGVLLLPLDVPCRLYMEEPV